MDNLDTIIEIGKIFVYGGIAVAFVAGTLLIAVLIIRSIMMFFAGTTDLEKKLDAQTEQLNEIENTLFRIEYKMERGETIGHDWHYRDEHGADKSDSDE